MTLTTERQQFAAQNEMSMEFVNWFFDEKKDGCGNAWFIMAAAMWEGWKGRATREAQPVAGELGEIRVGRLPTMNQENYPGLGDWWVQLRIGENHDDILARVYGATPEEAMARARALTAPPAPAYPERLPCPVHLLPGLKFGKGVPTRSMLDALVRRAEYESELDAMTPEQMAENDTRLEKLKALIPQPAPAVPVEIRNFYRAEGLAEVLKDAREYAPLTAEQWGTLVKNWHQTFVGLSGDANACRAAMLAQPVSSGYKLPPHLYRELVNSLRDTAVRFSGTEQLRERLNTALSQFIEPDHPHTRTVAPEGGNG